jgi:hypothetical protein
VLGILPLKLGVVVYVSICRGLGGAVANCKCRSGGLRIQDHLLDSETGSSPSFGPIPLFFADFKEALGSLLGFSGPFANSLHDGPWCSRGGDNATPFCDGEEDHLQGLRALEVRPWGGRARRKRTKTNSKHETNTRTEQGTLGILTAVREASSNIIFDPTNYASTRGRKEVGGKAVRLQL